MMLKALGKSSRESIGRKSTVTAELDRGAALLEDVAAVVRGFGGLEGVLRDLELYDRQAPLGCGTRWPYYIDAVSWLFGVDKRARCSNDRRAQQRTQKQEGQGPEKEDQDEDERMEEEEGEGSSNSSGDCNESGGSHSSNGGGVELKGTPGEGSVIVFTVDGVRMCVLVLAGAEEDENGGCMVSCLVSPNDAAPTACNRDRYGYGTLEVQLDIGDWCYGDGSRWSMRRPRTILDSLSRALDEGSCSEGRGSAALADASLPKKVGIKELRAFREDLWDPELQSKLLAFKDIGENFLRPLLYWSECDGEGSAFEVRGRLSRFDQELERIGCDIRFAISVCPSVFEHAQLLATHTDAAPLDELMRAAHTNLREMIRPLRQYMLRETAFWGHVIAEEAHAALWEDYVAARGHVETESRAARNRKVQQKQGMPLHNKQKHMAKNAATKEDGYMDDGGDAMDDLPMADPALSLAGLLDPRMGHIYARDMVMTGRHNLKRSAADVMHLKPAQVSQGLLDPKYEGPLVALNDRDDGKELWQLIELLAESGAPMAMRSDVGTWSFCGADRLRKLYTFVHRLFLYVNVGNGYSEHFVKIWKRQHHSQRRKASTSEVYVAAHTFPHPAFPSQKELAKLKNAITARPVVPELILTAESMQQMNATRIFSFADVDNQDEDISGDGKGEGGRDWEKEGFTSQPRPSNGLSPLARW